MFFLEVEGSKTILAFFGKLLNMIYIVVPILLIVFVSIDLLKAIISEDNEMISKTIHSIKRRVIACLVIFFLPTIVELLFTRVFVSLNMDEATYNEILSTYKSVINFEKVEISDSTKSNKISDELSYKTEQIDTTQQDINEIKFSNFSKNLTNYLLKSKSFKGFANSMITNDFVINYKDKNYNLKDNFNLDYKDLSTSDVIDNGNYVVSTILLKDVTINKEKYKEVNVNYYYKKDEKEYKLSNINIDIKDDIDIYNKKVKSSEKANNVKNIQKYKSTNKNYDYSKLNNLTDSDIKKIYNNNINNLVRFNTVYTGGIVNRATGFFIGNGMVATSWSYLQSSFILGNSISIMDVDNNSYKCSGVVSIDNINDIVVIKLDKNVNRSVKFGNVSTIKTNDPVVTISSKTGLGFSVISGIVDTIDKNIISVLPIDSNDWGSPLFDSNGNVIGMITSKLISSELSSSTLIEQLQKLKLDLKNTNYKNIKTTAIDKLKKDYYYIKLNKEEIKNNIPNKVWKKYKKIGDIENSINIDLVKTSYYDGIVSLRYSNPTGSSNTLDYASSFVENLKSDGYKMIFTSNEKTIYKKGKNQVVIMNEFDYLIIVLVKGGIL